ncbi:MAG: hypothetical protein H0W39_10085, partial [Sphingomonas sp.]|nr:hypothetical protein [Sphingomonas sp.]
MFAWRRALLSRHADTAAAVTTEWEKWLQLQRNESPDVSKPLLIVMAHLSCLEDVK